MRAGDPIKGHLDLLILATLRAEGQHGYALIEALRERSGGTFDLPEGTVYPALYRLERARLLDSRWEDGNGRRRRRVYGLTEAGERALIARTNEWHRFVGGVSSILDAAG